eukprot:CAMPEP_0119549908 /NCGR_PEP_ID=MMETSP1352-20130426/3540_1 /TAXON_ID=265584 /ORGANISM="Stauroneis constricta, Strain CCMP1120" /LENGTH=549 /DNA_ID=CAMNT_0007595607 /DNA_START=44 /DNA_END=1693 /DNA_ORIENTATION=-
MRVTKKSLERQQRRSISSIARNPIFLALSLLVGLTLTVSFFVVLQHDTLTSPSKAAAATADKNAAPAQQQRQRQASAPDNLDHLQPMTPYLPPFATLPNAQQYKQDTLYNNKPTIAGITAILTDFMKALHQLNVKNSENKAEAAEMQTSYYDLVGAHLRKFDEAYRNKSIFPIRNDNSIFISLAAFREHLLFPTLTSAFDQAEYPDNIFFGVIVQNCFGLEYGVQCRTGMEVIGKNKQGRDMTKISDAPADKNGIEEFCHSPNYSKYCETGQIRVVYMNETDALGPAVARYYASKLWGGENYFMQMDSHLEFAEHWDTQYIEEVKLTKNYPKSVLSAYPPGFQNFDGKYKGGTPGARLCSCVFSDSQVEQHIIRINTNGRSDPNAPRPTQIAYIAAGFFFAHAQFLVDVPFDPYLAWCFMGEEIALSMRAWTNGWNIYAPRLNLIAHQYRPGRLGLPKFWESVGRDSGRPNLNTRLQSHIIRRVKHMVGYPEDTLEKLQEDNDEHVLTDMEYYSLGTTRTREEYLQLAQIDVEEKKCHNLAWCNKGELE